jgi:hypothetical protein
VASRNSGQNRAKDILEIKGSGSRLGKPAIIAAEIKKGDQILKLRTRTVSPVEWGSRSPGNEL